MIGNKARAYYEQQAKERYKATVGRPSKSVETLPPISDSENSNKSESSGDKGKARDQAGRAVGVSGS